MSRRNSPLLAGLAAFTLGLLAAGCASSVTVVPGKSLALLDVYYPEGRMTGLPVAPGEETPTSRVGNALLREIGREGQYKISDARSLRMHARDFGKDPKNAATLAQLSPADAYLAVKLLDCAARPQRATETRGSGSSAVTVTVYWFAGECTAELTAFDAGGKSLAIVQKTGRWDSPKQERPDEASMQTQALSLAVDDTARRIARELRPSAAEKK